MAVRVNELSDKNCSPFFDIIAISETHLHDERGNANTNTNSLSVNDIQNSLPNYQFIGKSCACIKKGGVGFYIRNGLMDSVKIDYNLSIFKEGLFESLFLQIKGENHSGDLVIGTLYLPLWDAWSESQS